tara:strand:- start:1724 stop:1885 length:162 start_codon:yes stop_codon:yes gene_type:complete
VKVGDLVIFPDNGIVLEQGEDWENGEKMWRVMFFDGTEDWFYDGYCEVAKKFE